MTNADIHLYLTRNGQWRARVTQGGATDHQYTPSMKTQVGALVLACELLDPALAPLINEQATREGGV